jgi:hypothetical protein
MAARFYKGRQVRREPTYCQKFEPNGPTQYWPFEKFESALSGICSVIGVDMENVNTPSIEVVRLIHTNRAKYAQEAIICQCRGCESMGRRDTLFGDGNRRCVSALGSEFNRYCSTMGCGGDRIALCGKGASLYCINCVTLMSIMKSLHGDGYAVLRGVLSHLFACCTLTKIYAWARMYLPVIVNDRLIQADPNKEKEQCHFARTEINIIITRSLTWQASTLQLADFFVLMHRQPYKDVEKLTDRILQTGLLKRITDELLDLTASIRDNAIDDGDREKEDHATRIIKEYGAGMCSRYYLFAFMRCVKKLQGTPITDEQLPSAKCIRLSCIVACWICKMSITHGSNYIGKKLRDVMALCADEASWFVQYGIHAYAKMTNQPVYMRRQLKFYEGMFDTNGLLWGTYAFGDDDE